ncbi:hypothetical protein AAY473_001596 [Plecturocebus cupreus]
MIWKDQGGILSHFGEGLRHKLVLKKRGSILARRREDGPDSEMAASVFYGRPSEPPASVGPAGRCSDFLGSQSRDSNFAVEDESQESAVYKQPRFWKVLDCFITMDSKHSSNSKGISHYMNEYGIIARSWCLRSQRICGKVTR